MERIELTTTSEKYYQKTKTTDSTFHPSQMKYTQDILVGTSNIIEQQDGRNERKVWAQEQEKQQ